MPMCCVHKCSNSGGFTFPKDPELKQKWLDAIKREDTFTVKACTKVCGAHFTKEDFATEGAVSGLPITQRRRLKKGAVPSVFEIVKKPKVQKMHSAAQREQRALKRISKQLMANNVNGKCDFQANGTTNELTHLAAKSNTSRGRPVKSDVAASPVAMIVKCSRLEGPPPLAARPNTSQGQLITGDVTASPVAMIVNCSRQEGPAHIAARPDTSQGQLITGDVTASPVKCLKLEDSGKLVEKNDKSPSPHSSPRVTKLNHST